MLDISRQNWTYFWEKNTKDWKVVAFRGEIYLSFKWKILRINNRVEIWNSILGEMRDKTNERRPKLIDRLIFHLSREPV